MRAELAAAAAVIAASVGGVRYWDSNAGRLLSAPPAAAYRAGDVERGEVSQYRRRVARDEVRIPAAADQQFYVTAAVNAAPAPFLVDTGASFVAMRQSDAERAGVYTTWADFDHPVRTANGETKAALVTIRMIEIDNIQVENVKAFVLPDDQLGVNLLGMSFLSRIGGVEARNGELVLRG